MEMPPRTRQGGIGDDGNVDAPRGDGVDGVAQVELEGSAADAGVVQMLGVEVHIVGQGHVGHTHRHRRGEQAVHVLLLKPGVGQSANDALRLHQKLALVGGESGGMLVDADNGGSLSKVNHRRSLRGFSDASLEYADLGHIRSGWEKCQGTALDYNSST